MVRRIVVMVAALAIGAAFAAGASAADKNKKVTHRLKVTSADIAPRGTIKDEQVGNSFGCKSPNVSPEIKWSRAPEGTKSFAVTMFDPDAPTGSGFWHWVVFNIPADVTELPKGAGDPKAGTMPAGAVQSRTDFGAPGYGGPCPPAGDKPHRYRISVFAVDVDRLDTDADTPAAVVGFNLHYHTLAKGVLTGTYGRSQ